MITYKGERGWCEIALNDGTWSVNSCVAPTRFCSKCQRRFECWTMRSTGKTILCSTLKEAMKTAKRWYGDRTNGV